MKIKLEINATSLKKKKSYEILKNESETRKEIKNWSLGKQNGWLKNDKKKRSILKIDTDHIY